MALNPYLRVLAAEAANRSAACEAPATGSEQALFARYMQAPMRDHGSLSTLLKEQGEGVGTGETRFIEMAGFWNDDDKDRTVLAILERLEGAEEPLAEISEVISELSRVLDALKFLRQDFAHVAHAAKLLAADGAQV